MNFSIPSLFSTFFLLLGINMYPSEQNNMWKVSEGWHDTTNGYSLTLKSSTILNHCANNPEDSIVLPQIIHSFHELFVDSSLVTTFGDKDFSKAAPFYEKPILKCTALKAGAELTWKVTTYSKFFARLREWPQLKDNPNSSNIFNVALNIAAFAILIILSVFSILIYKGRVSNTLTYSLSFGSLILSGYFLNAANSYLGVTLSMLTSHKLADSCLWLGALFFINAFYAEGYLNKVTNQIFRAFCLLGIAVIILGKNGDEVQFGTMLPMGLFFYCSGQIVLNLFKNLPLDGMSTSKMLKVAAIFAFAFFGLNDALNVMGIVQSEMLLSLGSVGGFFGLSVSVSQAIEKTYDERDSLLHRLEDKVQEKTKHLEETLSALRDTQAELVQSARLASLGTLSAGIAHEINNSINYVSGALIPLERKIAAVVPVEDRGTIDKLLASIKEGTFLTVEIVKSLRHFTGLNQAQVKDVEVKSVVNSVLTILKGKTKNINIEVDVPETCKFVGNVVGFNQVIMNLLSNSVDALDKEQKQIRIVGRDLQDKIQITFEDNGSGIPKEIMGRIFDPFFTTKEVGKGTGLGLHIVMKEVKRHNGKIEVFSEPGVGTRFEIYLPKNAEETAGRAA